MHSYHRSMLLAMVLVFATGCGTLTREARSTTDCAKVIDDLARDTAQKRTETELFSLEEVLDYCHSDFKGRERAFRAYEAGANFYSLKATTDAEFVRSGMSPDRVKGRPHTNDEEVAWRAYSSFAGMLSADQPKVRR